MIKERLIEIINKECENERSMYKDFEKITSIKKETIRALANGRQKFNEEQITAIAKAFPQYKHWLVFGEELPVCGQISPRNKNIGKAKNKELLKKEMKNG